MEMDPNILEQLTLMKDPELLRRITNCTKLAEDCFNQFNRVQESIHEATKISAGIAAQPQLVMDSFNEAVREMTTKMWMFNQMKQMVEVMKKSCEAGNHRVETQTETEELFPVVEPAEGQGETHPSYPPSQESTPLDHGGDPPPVEIETAAESQAPQEAFPLNVQAFVLSVATTKLEILALVALMDSYFESQCRERDQNKPAFEDAGVPAPDPTPKNLIVDDAPSPLPKKMKASPESSPFKNSFDSVKILTKNVWSNLKATKGKGGYGSDRVPPPKPVPASWRPFHFRRYTARARRAIFLARNRLNPTSDSGLIGAAGESGVGTSGHGLRAYWIGSNGKAKRHKCCKDCHKPFTNKARFVNHRNMNVCKPSELTLD